MSQGGGRGIGARQLKRGAKPGVVRKLHVTAGRLRYIQGPLQRGRRFAQTPRARGDAVSSSRPDRGPAVTLYGKSASAPLGVLESVVSFLVALAVTFAAASFGAMFAPDPWYESLAKPAWTPPDSVFAPVWVTLYVLMAVAAWLVWARRPAFALPLKLWLAQLGLNALWPWLFLGLRQPALALLDIVLLAAAISATMWSFARVSRAAAILLVPYAAWVAFAAALNAAIVVLN